MIVHLRNIQGEEEAESMILKRSQYSLHCNMHAIGACNFGLCRLTCGPIALVTTTDLLT